MSVSFYDLSVASYLQCLGAVAGFLDKGRAHFEERGIALDEVVETRLYEDMLPLRFQIVSVVHHSLGALRGIEAGVFQPPGNSPDFGYAELHEQVAQARDELQQVSREQVDALAGKDVVFELGERKIPFSSESFVLSFSLPNLYFHAATAYDILRMKGVPVGKRDFLGQLRVKR